MQKHESRLSPNLAFGSGIFGKPTGKKKCKISNLPQSRDKLVHQIHGACHCIPWDTCIIELHEGTLPPVYQKTEKAPAGSSKPVTTENIGNWMLKEPLCLSTAHSEFTMNTYEYYYYRLIHSQTCFRAFP